MHIRFIRTAALALPALALWGCASYVPTQTYGLDPGTATLVRETCTEIMGLRAGHVEFDACTVSLSDSVRVVQNSHLILQAQELCEQQGVEPGTAALSKCIVLTSRAQDGAGVGALPSASETSSGKYYFGMTRPQQEESVELSCAQLGLHPASGAFKQCVWSLTDALFVAQNPL